MSEPLEQMSELLEPGTVVEGYEIAELLGCGSWADVYRAHQLKLGRDVAIKVLKLRDDPDDEVSELLEAEARTLARLSHPNIVHVIDCGRLGPRYYFVMEYVDGTDFKQILADGLYPLAKRLDIIVQSLRAVEYAHNNGVIHRDIKPANMLVSRDGHVKVADFGIATVSDTGDLARGGDSVIAGTPAYMSWEQLNDPGSVDQRADIYSLGVVLYEALTLQKPEDCAKLPSSLNAEVPTDFDSIVLKCLETKPNRRYETATDLRNDLLSATRALLEEKKTPTVAVSKKMSGIAAQSSFLDTLKESVYGSTYLVKNSRDGSLYVIKEIYRQVAGIREAKILSRIQHPNLVRVLAAHITKDRGVIVTEYLKGGSLADRLAKPYSLFEAMLVLKQVASGMSCAHSHGIIHGNLRPSNLLFDRSDNIKITDFALPEHYGRKRNNWYSAPERTRSPLSDIYSVGVILYQLLTTRLPFIGSQGELKWIANSADRRFVLLNILSQMLERDPSRRPQSFAAILRQIEPGRVITRPSRRPADHCATVIEHESSNAGDQQAATTQP